MSLNTRQLINAITFGNMLRGVIVSFLAMLFGFIMLFTYSWWITGDFIQSFVQSRDFILAFYNLISSIKQMGEAAFGLLFIIAIVLSPFCLIGIVKKLFRI